MAPIRSRDTNLIKYYAKKIFNKIIIKLLLARVELLSSEKGVGWIIPFNISELLKISIELLIKLKNSIFPIEIAKTKKENSAQDDMINNSFIFLFITKIKKNGI